MTSQKVVVVNGNAEMLGALDVALRAGHYDVVFVESNEHAYSHIKQVQPNLVVLFTRLGDPKSFQVLSMLKLDEETSRIPLLTYTTDQEGPDENENATETSETVLFAPQPVARMN